MKALTKFFVAAAAAASFAAVSAPASAITYISDWTVGPGGIALTFGDNGVSDPSGPGVYNPPADAGDGSSSHVYTNPFYTDTFNFTLPTGQVGFVLNSISFTLAAGVYFDSVNFNGTNLFLTNTPAGDGNIAMALTTSPISVYAGGPQVLTISGHVTGETGVWAGSGTFAPVPEAGTWALMILGFGGVGALVRNRRRQAAFA